MYRIPLDLDLSGVVGQVTTQVRVGQFDIQLAFGPVRFAVQSRVGVFGDGRVVARREPGRCPDPGFYDVMTAAATRCEVLNDRLLVLELENGIAMHLVDDSDQYE